eukprot:6292325-Prymnesium_polylepis.1
MSRPPAAGRRRSASCPATSWESRRYRRPSRWCTAPWLCHPPLRPWTWRPRRLPARQRVKLRPRPSVLMQCV